MWLGAAGWAVKGADAAAHAGALRTLVLRWTGPTCVAAAVEAGRVLGEHGAEARPGQHAILSDVPDGVPGVVAAALAPAGLQLTDLQRIIVVTGPGSFTALRIVIAYAHGLALSLGVPIVGVSLADALRTSVISGEMARFGGPNGSADPPMGRKDGLILPPDRPEIWFAGRDRMGRMLLDRGDGGPIQALADSDLPLPAGAVTLIGEAAMAAAASLHARGVDARAIDRAVPSVPEIAFAANLMTDTGSVRPVYVEAPAVTVSHGKGRPAPVA